MYEFTDFYRRSCAHNRATLALWRQLPTQHRAQYAKARGFAQWTPRSNRFYVRRHITLQEVQQ